MVLILLIKPRGIDTMELTVLSASFLGGTAIPSAHAYGGGSPPLAWSALPAGTKSIAIICDDPDAPSGDWVHWVIFNLPTDTWRLDAGVPRAARLPNGAVQGVNDFGGTGYEGPSPPPGRPHRYIFRVYALDATLALDSRARKKDVVEAMRGHVRAEGKLVGIYRR